MVLDIEASTSHIHVPLVHEIEEEGAEDGLDVKATAAEIFGTPVDDRFHYSIYQRITAFK